MPTTYWLTAGVMARQYGFETAINKARHMTRTAPRPARDFWSYVLHSLEQQMKAAKETAKPSN